jgi:hypothetical protein
MKRIIVFLLSSATWTRNVAVTFALSAGLMSICAPAGLASRQVRDRQARVIAQYVDVRAGASAAYVVNGRVYRDETFSVRGERGKKWVEVVTGKVRGWIPMEAIVILGPHGVALVGGKVDAGRDRRLRDYRYNADGRRLTRDEFTGSGEGTRTRPIQELSLFGEGMFTAVIGSAIGKIERVFRSNAPPDSVLADVRLKPSGLVVFADIDWSWQDWLKIRFSGSDLRWASSKVRLNAQADSAFSMSAEAQEGTADTTLSYTRPMWRISGLVGIGMQRLKFRPTQPTVLALSTTTLGIHGGVEVAVRKSRFEGRVRICYGRTQYVSQSPLTSGNGTGDYSRLETALTYWFHSSWGLRLNGRRVARQLNFTGEGDHTDQLSDANAPYSYTRAQESDQILWLGLGVVFSFL